MPPVYRRRALLATAASLLAGPAMAVSISNSMPWMPAAGDPPARVGPGQWQFFSPEEGAMIEALVDRLIPPDPETPGGKDFGCAVFIDRQLAGPYGRSAGLYMTPPFHQGTPEQGPQSAASPAQRYRQSLAALADHVRRGFAGKTLRDLPPEQQDGLIEDMAQGRVLGAAEGRAFFSLLLQNTKEGFFADPIYGGNVGMAGWRMIGFPGVRYDYRDWVERHNEKYPHPPVSLAGRAAWQNGKS